MLNVQQNINIEKREKKFDLEERTFKFSESIISFIKKVPQDIITRPLISQLVRSATSIGANYGEASEANSRRDFINKAAIAKKEAKETRYWLKIIASTIAATAGEVSVLLQEAQELNLILAAMIRNSKQ